MHALIFVSAFFRHRASLGCEILAIRSQLTFYEESIRQERQPRPRFNPAFRLLWVCLANCNFASQRACHNVTSPRRMLFISKALVILAKHSRKHPCNNALRSLYLVDFKFGQSFSGATIPSVSFRRNSSEFRERQYSSRVSQRRLQLVRGSALLLRLP